MKKGITPIIAIILLLLITISVVALSQGIFTEAVDTASEDVDASLGAVTDSASKIVNVQSVGNNSANVTLTLQNAGAVNITNNDIQVTYGSTIYNCAAGLTIEKSKLGVCVLDLPVATCTDNTNFTIVFPNGAREEQECP